MKKERFDYVCSLGSSCLCATSLRDAGLRLSSGPFDWLLGPSLKSRVDLVANDFAGWLEPGDFEFLGNPEKFSNRIGYSHDWHMFKNTNFAAEGHLGYICRYALTPYFAVQGDARLSIMEGNFDRERITGVERMAPDIEFSLMAGICYDFNFRSKERRQKYYVEKNIIPYNTTEMPKFVAFIQQEDLDVVRYIDLITIVQYDTINDSVAILYHDTLVTRYKASSPSVEQYVPDSVSFDSIMMKRMLPYEMVFFDLDKWDIRPKEEMKIAKMARLMKAYPDKTFYLYGSADSKTGTVKRNDFLSKNRADSAYLRHKRRQSR